VIEDTKLSKHEDTDVARSAAIKKIHEDTPNGHNVNTKTLPRDGVAKRTVTGRKHKDPDGPGRNETPGKGHIGG